MSHRKFSPEQETEIVRRYQAGESSEVIARTIGVVTNGVTVRNTLRRLGVTLRESASAMNPVISEETKLAAIKMCVEGATYEDVSRHFGFAKGTLTTYMRAAGVRLPERAKNYRKHKINDAAFDALTPEALYWIGFLFADGHVSRDGGKIPRLIVGLSSKDRSHLEKFRTFLQSDYPIRTCAAHESAAAYDRGPKVKTGESVYFSPRSHGICDALDRYGFTTKRLRAPSPDVASSRDFWRGMIDGDGSLGMSGRYPYIRLAGQEPLIGAYREFVANQVVGLNSYVSNGLHHLATSGSTAVSIIRVLYAEPVQALVRKNAVAQKICATAKD